MLNDDLQKILADLQKGLTSNKYNSFVEQLSKITNLALII
jgi:hypothetical protein